MRRSLLPGLLAASARQPRTRVRAALRCSPSAGVLADGRLRREGWRLAAASGRRAAAAGLGRRRSDSDFADLKGVVEALLERFVASTGCGWTRRRGCAVPSRQDAPSSQLRRQLVGVVGACIRTSQSSSGSPTRAGSLSLTWKNCFRIVRPLTFRGLPRFPAVVRDLAVVVDEELRVRAKSIRFVREWRHANWIEDVDVVRSVHRRADPGREEEPGVLDLLPGCGPDADRRRGERAARAS